MEPIIPRYVVPCAETGVRVSITAPFAAMAAPASSSVAFERRHSTPALVSTKGYLLCMTAYNLCSQQVNVIASLTRRAVIGVHIVDCNNVLRLA